MSAAPVRAIDGASFAAVNTIILYSSGHGLSVMIGRTLAALEITRNEQGRMRMRTYLLSILVVSTMLGSGASSQAQQGASNGDEQALTALEMQWLKSDQTNNVDLAAPLLADKYTSMTVSGTIEDRAQTLAYYKTRKYSSAEYEGGIKVVVSGDTAITRGVYIGTGTDSGKPFQEHLRWTDTWVRHGGKWQCLASHYSKI